MRNTQAREHRTSPRAQSVRRIGPLAVLAALLGGGCQAKPSTRQADPSQSTAVEAVELKPVDLRVGASDPFMQRTIEPAAAPFWQEVPAAAYKFEMMPIPGDPAQGIKPFWMSRTEITWEAFDVYVYRLDEDSAAPAPAAGKPGPDAVTRPTKPYLPPDRGFGHEGFAAITMSHRNATEFCVWLSKKSGRHYRLPTEKEWEYACLAGSRGPYGMPDSGDLAACAWYAVNADGTPHEVAKKQPNAWGLCDMHGNVAEWADGSDGAPVTKGGSYQDPADKLKADARAPNDPAWNASDPQIPKSKWWLANAPFVGFRVVCDDPQ